MSDIKSAVDSYIKAYTEISPGSKGNKSARSVLPKLIIARKNLNYLKLLLYLFLLNYFVMCRVKDVETNKCVSEKVLSWLYLIASNPHMIPAQIFEVLVNLLESKDFALYMSKKIQSLIANHKGDLLLSKRHPVILIIDEV